MDTAIEYDEYGRMKYNPEFHYNHGKPFTEEELEYMCKYYEHDHPRAIGFALGRTEGTIRAKVNYLKKIGLYEYYKNRGKYW